MEPNYLHACMASSSFSSSLKPAYDLRKSCHTNPTIGSLNCNRNIHVSSASFGDMKSRRFSSSSYLRSGEILQLHPDYVPASSEHIASRRLSSHLKPACHLGISCQKNSMFDCRSCFNVSLASASLPCRCNRSCRSLRLGHNLRSSPLKESRSWVHVFPAYFSGWFVSRKYSFRLMRTCDRRKPCGGNDGQVHKARGDNSFTLDHIVEGRKKYVSWFREAWPYIQGHQDSTFVLVISSEVVDSLFVEKIFQDLSLLHGLGIKLVIAPATHIQIDRILLQKGCKPQFVGQYRITDAAALEASLEAAGKVRLAIEAKLSPGPSIPIVRRHGENGRWHVGVSVASGNFLAAKRRGVVNGVDFGATGEVKRIHVDRIKERLERNCIVVLGNLGYSSSGEVLNCNTYEVATACAIALQADKLICLVDGPVLDENGYLMRFISLNDADRLIRNWAEQSETAANYVKAVANNDYLRSLGVNNTEQLNGTIKGRSHIDHADGSSLLTEQGFAIGGEESFCRRYGYLSELIAAVFVCRGGVRRVHLLDSTNEGVLLLELYTRDGVGTMVYSDMYEGTRSAKLSDLHSIKKLLQPLEETGVLVSRSIEQLAREIDSFIVVERDGSIIACAALFPFYEEKCAELAAFVVSFECRGHGQGEDLLEYVEEKAKNLGLESLFVLTTRTADWFVSRGFVECTIDHIPTRRLQTVNPARGSKYYIKKLQPRNDELNLGSLTSVING